MALLRVKHADFACWQIAKRRKVMEFIKKNLLAVIVAGAGLLALILGLILPGATLTIGSETGTINFLGLVFGNATLTVSGGGASVAMKFGDGGMSIFGLISILALVAGIALTIVSIFVKDKKFDFIGAILVAVAGVFMFLLLVAGTDITSGAISTSFADAYKEYSLGIGAILYAIIAILGGAFGIVNKFKKII